MSACVGCSPPSFTTIDNCPEGFVATGVAQWQQRSGHDKISHTLQSPQRVHERLRMRHRPIVAQIQSVNSRAAQPG